MYQLLEMYLDIINQELHHEDLYQDPKDSFLPHYV